MNTLDEEQEFDYDEVKRCITKAIEQVVGHEMYTERNVDEWTTSIIEGALRGLQLLNKPYKYVVTCVLMQKNGAGLHSASTCYWDGSRDGSCSVSWENDTMNVMTTAFALSVA
ncbi:MAG: hypothetical protein MHM6MM_001165 [Cercozoa sp. M6MM]